MTFTEAICMRRAGPSTGDGRTTHRHRDENPNSKHQIPNNTDIQSPGPNTWLSRLNLFGIWVFGFPIFLPDEGGLQHRFLVTSTVALWVDRHRQGGNVAR